MACPVCCGGVAVAAAPDDGQPVAPVMARLALLATLFFMWGFITVINNTLLPHLRSVFDLNYTQTTLIDPCGSSPISLPRSLGQADREDRLQGRWSPAC
jgi:hypothetical protein